MESERTQREQRDASREFRSERISRLQKKVDTLFSEEFQRELRENITRSFLVPQIGEYHNEGLFMDSHLDLILKNIDNVRKNIFPDDLSPSVQRMLNQAANADMQSVEKYEACKQLADELEKLSGLDKNKVHHPPHPTKTPKKTLGSFPYY